MNALLVGASPALGAAANLVGLASDFELVIAVDGGADVCYEAGVTPDVVLGDLDSVSPATLRAMRSAGVKIVAFPAEKDETDLALALQEARLRDASSVTFTGVTGGRLDHMLGVIAVLRSAGDLGAELAEPGLHGWVLSSHSRARLAVQGRGDLLSLLPLSGSAMVTVGGVRWPLERTILTDCETRGVSNVIMSDEATIVVHEGQLLVISGAQRS